MGLPAQEPLEVEESREQSHDQSRDTQAESRGDDDIITDDVIEHIVAAATSGSSDEGEVSSDDGEGKTLGSSSKGNNNWGEHDLYGNQSHHLRALVVLTRFSLFRSGGGRAGGGEAARGADHLHHQATG